MDHTYVLPFPSPPEVDTKAHYDKVGRDSSGDIAKCVRNQHYDVAEFVRDNLGLYIENNILEVPNVVLEPAARVMSHIVVGADAGFSTVTITTGEMGEVPTIPIHAPILETVMYCQKDESKTTVVTERVTDAHILASRVSRAPWAKSKVSPVLSTPAERDGDKKEEMGDNSEEARAWMQCTGSAYKCEVCHMNFDTEQVVAEHFKEAHEESIDHIIQSLTGLGMTTVPEYDFFDCSNAPDVQQYITISTSEYIEIESDVERVVQDINSLDIDDNNPAVPDAVTTAMSRIEVGAEDGSFCETISTGEMPQHLTLENSRARVDHTYPRHREGLQCYVCKKSVLTKYSMRRHIRALHSTPIPQEECTICHKMVRVVQLKSHIQRHEDKTRVECVDCKITFSRYANYRSHMRYSRAHATQEVLRFPCPVCNKGYLSKEAMQDHYNYQHLGKTLHKCPVCSKALASRQCIARHLRRVHNGGMESLRDKICQECGKGFKDKKSLGEHELTHTGERPQCCTVCGKKFRQQSVLYAHKKRVHNLITPAKPVQLLQNNGSKDPSWL